MHIYTIYRATNTINGKVYIGFDSAWPKRKSDHKTDSSIRYNKNNKFYNAIRKYGWNSFVWEPIYQSMDYEYTLNNMETFFIIEYDSIANGYNTNLGGSSGRLGATWWNNGIKNSLSLLPPGPTYIKGRLPFNTVKGTSWWNNGIDQVMTINCPGTGYKPGRIPKTEPSRFEQQYILNPKACSICSILLAFGQRKFVTCGSTDCIAQQDLNAKAKQRDGQLRRWAKSRYTLAGNNLQ